MTLNRIQETIASGKARFEVRFAFFPTKLVTGWTWFQSYAEVYRMTRCIKGNFDSLVGRAKLEDLVFPPLKEPQIRLIK